jgi:cyclic beta-1,2-glucan synthetase
MASVMERLIKRDDRLILLFTPPFDKTKNDPGYIRGYLPGIRENGGQYTHAALWAVWAFTKLGRGDLAGELFRLLNPVYHTDSAENVQRYQVEPYVVAADVYSNPAHTGHGGWTWYTGSSGWMYRLGMEAILGLRRRGDRLEIDPCIPTDWEGYEITYRHGEASYHIRVDNPDGVSTGVKEMVLDGQEQSGAAIPLEDDGEEHHVQIVMGTQAEG